MERYGSITTPVSVPRLIVGAMLAAGVAVLILAFTQYGLLAGLAVSVIPAALCILWVTLRNPAISMLGLFVVNYFIMALTRYAHDLPFGMILDALIFYNFLIITLQALIRPIEWKRASSGLTVVAAIWMAYCILEIVNPESVSVAGWDDPRRADLLQLSDYHAASPDTPHRMETRQFGTDRRGGDLDGLLHP